MKLIGQGNTAEIYEYDEGKILKVFRDGLGDYVIQLEYNNSYVVSKVLGDLVPKVYGKIEYENRPGIIYEKIVGKEMLKKMILNLFCLGKNARQFARYHVAIQQETTEEMLSVKEKLKNEIQGVTELNEEERSKILDILDKLPEGKSLCHFDFHPGNIMLRDGKAVVLDWMTACVGAPCADAARSSMMMQYAEVPRVSKLVNAFMRTIFRKTYRHYIKEYLRLTGYQMKDIEAWYLPVMAARFREWIPDKERETLLAEIKRRLNE